MTDSVIFDMDGVLFDSERIYNEAWYRVGNKMNLSAIEVCISYCVGRNGKDIRSYLLESYGSSFPVEQFSTDIKQEFDLIVAAEGLPTKPGANEILSWLREAGVKLGLATSSSRKSAERHLKDAGMMDYFSHVVTGDMIQNGKPDPEIYRLACEKLDVTAENCFAVEDSPNGIKSAFGAGLKVIMVPDLIMPTEDIEKLLFKKFDSLLDLKTYFENL